MTQEFKFACVCGTKIRIKIAKATDIEVYCDNCNCQIFPSEENDAEVENTVMSPQTGKEMEIARDERNIETVMADKPEVMNPREMQTLRGVQDIRTPSAKESSRKKMPEKNVKSFHLASSAMDSPTQLSPADLKMIGVYKIIQKLGEGGMAEVFLASHKDTQEEVVIKIIKTDIAETMRDKMREYFARESHVLKGIKHPNIVKYIGSGEHAGVSYMVMEFVAGETLEKELQSGTMKISQVIPIVAQLASALEYAESLKIIHRDIKPANIILTAQNKCVPKLIDFGLAKVLEESGSLTNTGSMMGSLYWMPPEQIQDAKRADHRSDIYSLGATFYHMLGCQAPYVEFGPKRLEIINAILQNHLKPLFQIRPGLPDKIYQIVSKSMAHDRKDRYTSAKDFRKDLEDFVISLRK